MYHVTHHNDHPHDDPCKAFATTYSPPHEDQCVVGYYEASDEISVVIRHFQSTPSVQEDKDLMAVSLDIRNWLTIAPHVWSLDTGDGDGDWFALTVREVK